MAKKNSDSIQDSNAIGVALQRLVRQLREMLDEYELIKRERAAMQQTPAARWPRLPDGWAALQDRADKVSGRIMRQERAIVDLLLSLPNAELTDAKRSVK